MLLLLLLLLFVYFWVAEHKIYEILKRKQHLNNKNSKNKFSLIFSAMRKEIEK